LKYNQYPDFVGLSSKEAGDKARQLLEEVFVGLSSKKAGNKARQLLEEVKKNGF